MSKRPFHSNVFVGMILGAVMAVGVGASASPMKDDCSELLGGNCSQREPAKDVSEPTQVKSVPLSSQAKELPDTSAPEEPVRPSKPVQVAKAVLPPPEAAKPSVTAAEQAEDLLGADKNRKPAPVPVKPPPVRAVASKPTAERPQNATHREPTAAKPKPAPRPEAAPAAPIRFASVEKNRVPEPVQRQVFSPSAKPAAIPQVAPRQFAAFQSVGVPPAQASQPKRIEIRLQSVAQGPVPVDAQFRHMERQAELACSSVLGGLPDTHPEWLKCIGAEVEYRVYHSGNPQIVSFFQSLITLR